VCLFFARSREITGVSEKQYNIPQGTNTQQFVDILLADYSPLSEILKVSLLSVNLEYIDRGASVILKEGDEIAIIPPISGG